jgi:hypothetical protein
MEKTLEDTSHVTGRITSNSLLRGLGWGSIGGLAGTLVMDLVLMGVLSEFKAPAPATSRACSSVGVMRISKLGRSTL